MQEVFADMTQAPRWRDALDGGLSPAELLDGYEAMVDWPGSYYYRELMEAFPDAKVLLSVRDGDAWAKSMQETIWSLFYGDTLVRHLSDAQTFVDPLWKRVHRDDEGDVAPDRADGRARPRRSST